jgi:SAM-dependent methyltransferase
MCGGCEVIYLSPQPTAADLEFLYEGSEQFTEACYTADTQVRRLLGNYARRLETLGLFPRAGERVLEVGAGLAWVSRVCKQRDSRIVTVAQDVSAECAQHCPWVDQYVVGSLDALGAGERFHLISMTHVIEHLLEPAAMLKRLAGHLVDGGAIYITAPYRPPLWDERQGIRPWLSYSYLHVPAHISYLSKRWFMEASAACGLRLAAWDPSHDGHQAFEAVLRKSRSEGPARRLP